MTPPTIPCRACGSGNRVEPERLRRGLEPVCGRCRAPLGVSARPVDVTDETFEDEVLESTLPVLLDVWAAWCLPGRAMEPVLRDVAFTLAGHVRVAKLDLDRNPTTVGRLRVQGVPTLIVFEKGHEVTRMIGARDRDELLRRLGPVA